MEHYTTYWPADWLQSIIANYPDDRLTVIYGGDHRSQPAFGKVGVGDVVYPVTLIRGGLYSKAL
ncbi:MAG: hypothetical protein ACRCWR_03600 [Saezia sp.]